MSPGVIDKDRYFKFSRVTEQEKGFTQLAEMQSSNSTEPANWAYYFII